MKDDRRSIERKIGRHSVSVLPLAGALGAEVRGIDLLEIDAKSRSDIEFLLWEYHVLFFPEQSLSDEDQVAFGQLFGPLENHPHLENPTPGLPNTMFELSASHGGVADEWHTDLTFLPSPALYSILKMVKAPGVGGDTLWANPIAAFEHLSEPIKALLRGLHAVHNAEPHGRPNEVAVHPVVRSYPPTGKEVLYVNEHFTRRIVELSHLESELLLDYLTRFLAQPRFTVRYRWAEGTLAIWDNRATQHYVLNDFSEERVIHRVTVMGDQVIPVGSATDWPVFTRHSGPSDTSRHDSQLMGWLAASGEDSGNNDSAIS